jgi:predicted permease
MKIAFRRLLKSPGFTLVAVLTLALGIGSTTAIFSVVDAVLLRPLGLAEPERILTFWSHNTVRGTRYNVSGPDFDDWRAQSRSFDFLARYQVGDTGVVVGDTAEKVNAAFVSADFLPALGLTPLFGRAFNDSETRGGGAALVSLGFARRHFQEPERALGATLHVLGRPEQIVGVMPDTTDFPARCEVWLPIDGLFPPIAVRSAHNYRALGRLKPGVTLEQAQLELRGIARRLEQQYPDSNTHKGAELLPLQSYLVRNHRATLWIIFGAVGLVLLIACANVANLLLARGLARTREVAICAALGAAPGRIIRILLTESLLLSGLAGALGLLLATAGIRAIVALAPAGVPHLAEVGLDGRALGFATAVSLVVCLVAGLVPAIHSARTDLKIALQAGGRSVVSGAGRLRGALVVTQFALSVMLLTGAGLLLRSFEKLLAVDPGYRPTSVLVMTAEFPASNAAEFERGAAFYRDFLREASALPGVSSVSATQGLPIDEGSNNGTYRIQGRPDPAPGDATQNAQWRLVGPHYFSTLGIRVIRGREFDERDQPTTEHGVIINETMARAAWPNADPLGQRLRIGWNEETARGLTVIGVVADTKQGTLDTLVRQELTVAMTQFPPLATEMKIVARTVVKPETLSAPFRALAQRLNPSVPVSFTTADLLISDTLTAPRFRTLLLSVFALVALVLALVGVAGVMACVVAERRSEIGIRMAIGARPQDMVRHFLLHGLRLAALGLAIGLAGALLGARLLQGFLFDVSTSDPLILAAVGSLLFLAALIASALPAWRASRIDPLIALRSE